MFILLHDDTRDKNAETVVNMDTVKMMYTNAKGGTVLVFEVANSFLSVEESISDIFARMRKE